MEGSPEASPEARSQSTEVVEEKRDSEPGLPEPCNPESLADPGFHGVSQP